MQPTAQEVQTTVSLAQSYEKAKAADPGARSRDIADRLGVTEGMLADARIGPTVKRLALQGAEFATLLRSLRAVGPVMTLTRNEAAVHETTGEIGEVEEFGVMGQITGAIDLRLFFRHWHAGYAVSEETKSGLRHSIQVFDAAGTAVLKVYATGASDLSTWHRLVGEHTAQNAQIVAFSPAEAGPEDVPDEEIDRAVLRREWTALQHSHDFHRMLRELGVGREQALRLAGEDLAWRADIGIVERVLQGAAKGAVPIMCFVGNPGCLQIYAGPVQQISVMGPWLNVLDPGFNLHLRTDRVASAWVVLKPTQMRGRITSIELFDSRSTMICQIFGDRPPGEGERESWRSLVADTSIGAA
ncbi:MAG: ChuX/HutX family heme-like substrate-binding protein [Pseudomonadota bacterium]